MARDMLTDSFHYLDHVTVGILVLEKDSQSDL